MGSMRDLLLIGIGGAGGAIARSLVTSAVARAGFSGAFPLATLLVNVSGCFCFGLAMQFAVQSSPMGRTTRPLVLTGFCGAFTTFSALSYEIVEALERGRSGLVTTYVMASLILGVLAMLAGVMVGQKLSR
jgi:fluoride exporter